MLLVPDELEHNEHKFYDVDPLLVEAAKLLLKVYQAVLLDVVQYLVDRKFIYLQSIHGLVFLMGNGVNHFIYVIGV